MSIERYKTHEPLFGNWHIQETLGNGSYGTVYKIKRHDYGVTYEAALKAITIPQSQSEVESIGAEGMDDGSITAYFRQMVEEVVGEIALMSKLKGNSNIVSYEDHTVIPHAGTVGWDILIRMELLTPLIKHVRNTPIAQNEVIKLGIHLCKALELCQKHNIIHRDIKPENIFVSDNGEYKLGDFGISRTIEKTTGVLSQRGTFTYIAPEVFHGKPYGSSVDIYSLGIVMYWLLNEKRTPLLPSYPQPITPKDREMAFIKRISGEALPPPSMADARLAEIVLKMCAYERKDRYDSLALLRADLEAILHTEDAAKAVTSYEQAAPLRVGSINEIHDEEKSQPAVAEGEAHPTMAEGEARPAEAGGEAHPTKAGGEAPPTKAKGKPRFVIARSKATKQSSNQKPWIASATPRNDGADAYRADDTDTFPKNELPNKMMPLGTSDKTVALSSLFANIDTTPTDDSPPPTTTHPHDAPPNPSREEMIEMAKQLAELVKADKPNNEMVAIAQELAELVKGTPQDTEEKSEAPSASEGVERVSKHEPEHIPVYDATASVPYVSSQENEIIVEAPINPKLAVAMRHLSILIMCTIGLAVVLYVLSSNLSWFVWDLSHSLASVIAGTLLFCYTTKRLGNKAISVALYILAFAMLAGTVVFGSITIFSWRFLGHVDAIAYVFFAFSAPFAYISFVCTKSHKTRLPALVVACLVLIYIVFYMSYYAFSSWYGRLHLHEFFMILVDLLIIIWILLWFIDQYLRSRSKDR